MSRNKNRRKYNKLNRCEQCGSIDFVFRYMSNRYAKVCAYCSYFKSWANNDDILKIYGGNFDELQKKD